MLGFVIAGFTTKPTKTKTLSAETQRRNQIEWELSEVSFTFSLSFSLYLYTHTYTQTLSLTRTLTDIYSHARGYSYSPIIRIQWHYFRIRLSLLSLVMTWSLKSLLSQFCYISPPYFSHFVTKLHIDGNLFWTFKAMISQASRLELEAHPLFKPRLKKHIFCFTTLRLLVELVVSFLFNQPLSGTSLFSSSTHLHT